MQKLKQQVLMREVREEINCVLESRIDKAYEAWYASEKEKCFELSMRLSEMVCLKFQCQT
jgi:hypothetical protein